MKLIKFIVFSNIWVSLGAAAFTVFTYVSHTIFPNTYYLLFIFSATLAAYTFHRLIRFFYQKIDYTTLSQRHFWIIRHKKTQFAIFLLSGLLAGYALIHLPVYQLAKLLFVSTFPVLFYILPPNRFFKGLRHIPYLKVPVVGVVWMFLCGYIPLKTEQADFSYFFLASQFLFIVAITLPFEIRDIKVDTAEKVKSFATVLGVKNTQRLSVMLLGLSSIFIWLDNTISLAALLSWVFTVLVSIPVILNSSDKRSELYFSGLVEAILLFPAGFYPLLLFILP